MFKNIFKLLTLATVYSALVKGDAASLEYTKEGVLRKQDECSINFVNFGINKDISNLNVKKINNPNGTFNLKIDDLKNGNLGINNANTGYTFKDNEIKNYIKVSQNGSSFNDFDVTPAANGRFSLLLKNLKSCDDLSIKQTFKAPVLMNTYLYYSNVKPDGINHAFDIVEFGPSSNNVPYDTLKWDMNTGLDSARENCRIYIDFHEYDYTGGFHWKWYLSTDNINGEKCDNPAFYKAVKDSYLNYENMEELFGDHYNGYVIKREGSGVGHMDGILVNQKYLIEIYQNGCDEQNKDQVICTISSNKKLSYEEFTKEFVENCSSVIDDSSEKPEWSVDANGVYAKFDKYSLDIVNYNRGALPKSASESVTYKEFKAANSSGIARFSVSTTCGNGTYVGEKCKCISCPDNCTQCLDGNTCTECALGYILVGGECKIITTTTTTTTTTITTTVTRPATTTTTEVEEIETETETVSAATEEDVPTESVEVVVSDDEELPTEANDSDVEEEEEVNEEPTVVDEGNDSDIEEATEAEDDAETESADEKEQEEEVPEKKEEAPVEKPKKTRKCYVRKH